MLLDDRATPPSHAPPGDRAARPSRADGVRYRGYTTTLRDPALGGLARAAGDDARSRRSSAASARSSAAWPRSACSCCVVAGAGVFLAADARAAPAAPAARGRPRASPATRTSPAASRPTTGPRETRALAGSFNAMLARLGRSAADRERALAATRRFAADAGHELRTPLTSVQATLSALSRHPELAAARRAAMLDGALQEHDRLVRAARRPAGARPRRRRAARAPRPSTSASWSTPPRGRAPRAIPASRWRPRRPTGAGRRRRAGSRGCGILVENLIENAARHGRPGGRVRVALAAATTGPARAGRRRRRPRRAAADRARIFEPFARSTAPAAPARASGWRSSPSRPATTGRTVEVGDSPLGGARFAVAFPA